jgi:hypothetical protein
MTTRHRRSPEAISADALRPTLKRLETRAAKSKAIAQRDEAEAEAMRRKIAMINQLPLPGGEEPLPPIDRTTLAQRILTGLHYDCGVPECPIHHGGNAPYCPDAPEPAQDRPPAQQDEASAPVAEDVGAETIVIVAPLEVSHPQPNESPVSDTPIADERNAARERAAARRAARVEGKCPHGFLTGWCSKEECQPTIIT